MNPAEEIPPRCILWDRQNLTADDVASRLQSMSSQQREKIEYLTLEGNIMDRIPREILELPNLKLLNVSRNRVISIPRGVGNLQHLRALIIPENRLKRLPGSLIKLKNLESLVLHDNPALPLKFSAGTTGDQIKTQQFLKEVVTHYNDSPSTACVCLLALRRLRQSTLSVFPKDLVTMIARELWTTRDDDRWQKLTAPKMPN